MVTKVIICPHCGSSDLVQNRSDAAKSPRPRKKEIVPLAKEQARFSKRMKRQGGLEVSCVSVDFAKQSHFLSEAFPRDPRYINVYDHGQRNAASGPRAVWRCSGVRAAPYRGSAPSCFRSGRLREGVRPVLAPRMKV